MESHSFSRLRSHILARSEADKFEIARHEWRVTGVELVQEMDQCPCGQEIMELCYIKNRKTGHLTYVGNVCVKRFIGRSTGNLFEGLRRIQEDIEANLNEDLIEYAWAKGYLTSEKEYRFLRRTRKKRLLSPAQVRWKSDVNRRILRRIEAAGKAGRLRCAQVA